MPDLSFPSGMFCSYKHFEVLACSTLEVFSLFHSPPCPHQLNRSTALSVSDSQQFRSYSVRIFLQMQFFFYSFCFFCFVFLFFFLRCVSGFTKIFVMLHFQKTRSPMASPPLIWVPSWRWLKGPELPPCCVLPAETRTRRSPGSRTCFLWTSAAVTAALNSFVQVQFDLITLQTHFDLIRLSHLDVSDNLNRTNASCRDMRMM